MAMKSNAAYENGKKQSITKFSNYVSSSNNLSPIPNSYAKVFQHYKETKVGGGNG